MHPVIIETEDRLAELVRRLSGFKVIAVDTESNSLYAYYERLCLIQISADEKNYVIDTLKIPDASALKPLFEDPGIEKVMHAAESDVRIIKAELDCEVRNVFDTMTAARFLGIKACGLSSLLGGFFGVQLNKKMQKADWGRRPIPAEMLDYAAADTHYLLRLKGTLQKQLEEKGLFSEAREEFHRISLLTSKPRKFREDAYLSIAASRLMDGRCLAVLKELYVAREKKAMELDRPVFKIISEDLMIRLAMHPRDSLHSFEKMRGVTPYIIHKHGQWIKSAIQKGLAASEVVRVKRHIDRTAFEAAKKRLELLRAWRRIKAEEKKVEADIILPGEVLNKIASSNPVTSEELKLVSGLGEHKFRLYGQEILTVLKEEKRE